MFGDHSDQFMDTPNNSSTESDDSSLMGFAPVEVIHVDFYSGTIPSFPLLQARGLIYETIQGEQWLCLGGSVRRLPSNTAAVHFDHVLSPILDSLNNSFRVPIGKLSWIYSQYDQASAAHFTDPKNLSQVDSELIHIITGDLCVLKSMLDQFKDAGHPTLTRVDVNFSISVQGLKDTFGIDSIIQKICAARNQALELIAAACYNLAHVDEQMRAAIRLLYGLRMCIWLFHEEKLEAIMDPNDLYFYTYPILKLCHGNCPIYLP
ncbi:hypothetical protein BDY19DRAFT_995732 [Irpex rosettiformis]|uniref:Uncharacterized protein n=1 Tax=Irpex rosettiformis TaxID=378272 RepID=A0ACB8TXM3_9APHY|nr:hypothetical protein BDY19DRAFT_995732 [Irpex rosettiformis]